MEQEIKKEMGKAVEPAAMPAQKGKNTTMAIIAYLVFFIPLLTEDKNDPFVKFHVKQGIVLFVAMVAAGFFGYIPLIGWFLAPWLSLAILVLLAIGIINASKGLEKPLPLIGKFANNIKI